MHKIISYILPIFILIVFILIMTTGGLLKKPLCMQDDISTYLTLIENSIENKEWMDAENNIDALSTAWKQVQKRVQFSVERQELTMMSLSISHLKGSVQAKSQGLSFVYLYALKEIWNDLEK